MNPFYLLRLIFENTLPVRIVNFSYFAISVTLFSVPDLFPESFLDWARGFFVSIVVVQVLQLFVLIGSTVSTQNGVPKNSPRDFKAQTIERIIHAYAVIGLLIIGGIIIYLASLNYPTSMLVGIGVNAGYFIEMRFSRITGEQGNDTLRQISYSSLVTIFSFVVSTSLLSRAMMANSDLGSASEVGILAIVGLGFFGFRLAWEPFLAALVQQNWSE